MADPLLDTKILTEAVAKYEHFDEGVQRLERAIVDLSAPLWKENGVVGRDYGPGLEAYVRVGSGRNAYETTVPREPIIQILRGELAELIKLRDDAQAIVQRAAAATRNEP